MSNLYRITFCLSSPVVYIDLPMFDGIIAKCWEREKLNAGQEFEPLSISVNELRNFDDMPIERHPDGYFLASRMFGRADREQVYYKRNKWEDTFDHIADFGKRKRKFSVQSGPLKSIELPRVAHIFESTHHGLPWSSFGHVWFFFAGNANAVQQLVDKHLVGIGKDTGQGAGWFSQYLIEKTDKTFDALLMRPVPATTYKGNVVDAMRSGISLRFVLMPPSPPYWDATRAIRCVVADNVVE